MNIQGKNEFNSLVSDPHSKRYNFTFAVPWVCKLINEFLPLHILDFMINFMISVALTICCIFGIYKLPWKNISKRTEKLRFNFKTRKKGRLECKCRKSHVMCQESEPRQHFRI